MRLSATRLTSIAQAGGGRTLIQRAIAVLRKYGTDAHIYLPGVGVLNGLQAGNYIDSALTTPAAIDNPVGGVVDAMGGINATQPTTSAKPILRRDAGGRYYWQFDGSNDSLSLGGPLFQMADDHCVIAGGMYSGNNSSNNVVASPSQGAAITNRAGQVSYDDNNDSLQSSWYDGVNYDKLEFSYPKETGFVATAAKRGSLVIQRVGGVQRGTKSATVAFVSDRGSIGAYSGGQNQFNGSIYPVIAIKGTVSDADLLLLEKLVGQMSGVTI